MALHGIDRDFIPRTTCVTTIQRRCVNREMRRDGIFFLVSRFESVTRSRCAIVLVANYIFNAITTWCSLSLSHWLTESRGIITAFDFTKQTWPVLVIASHRARRTVTQNQSRASYVWCLVCIWMNSRRWWCHTIVADSLKCSRYMPLGCCVRRFARAVAKWSQFATTRLRQPANYPELVPKSSVKAKLRMRN